MPLLCMSCYEIYGDDLKQTISYLTEKRIDCPKSNCDGEVVKVDELMLPINDY